MQVVIYAWYIMTVNTEYLVVFIFYLTVYAETDTASIQSWNLCFSACFLPFCPIMPLGYMANHCIISVQGEGFFGTVYKAQAHGITVPGRWSTVAVKMIKSKQF